jgi:hypothetical protein
MEDFIMTNNEIIQKADLVLSDLKSNGGYLDAQQGEKFIRMVQDAPTIMKDCRVVTFPGDSMKIEKIGFADRILRKGVENTALDASKRAKPTSGMVQLTTKEVIAEVRLSYDTIEANLEKEGFKDTIMAMIAERAAVDLEELIINGDTAHATDDYLALLNGVIKQVKAGNSLDWKAQPISDSLWAETYLKVPEKFIRVPEQYKFYTDRTTELRWRQLIAQRNTAVGDRYLLENTNTSALGVPIQRVSLMPSNLSYDPDGEGAEAAITGLGQSILIHPKNIITGISRKIQVETDKDITARQYIIVLTMKLDVAIEEIQASGYVYNIKPALA